MITPHDSATKPARNTYWDKNAIRKELLRNIDSILNCRHIDDANIHYFNGSCTVFCLKKFANIIFKTRTIGLHSNLSLSFCANRLRKYVRAKEILYKAKYSLLDLPKTELISVCYDDQKIFFCMEEKLNVFAHVFIDDTVRSALMKIEEENIMLANADRYRETLKQLTSFVFEMRIGDVASRNFPVNIDSINDKSSLLRIGLVDLEQSLAKVELGLERLPGCFMAEQHIKDFEAFVEAKVQKGLLCDLSNHILERRKRELYRKRCLDAYHRTEHLYGFENIPLVVMRKEEFDIVLGIVDRYLQDSIYSKYEYLHRIYNPYKKVLCSCRKALKKFKNSRFEVFKYRNDDAMVFPNVFINKRGEILPSPKYDNGVRQSNKVFSKGTAVKYINKYVMRYTNMFNKAIKRNSLYSLVSVEARRHIVISHRLYNIKHLRRKSIFERLCNLLDGSQVLTLNSYPLHNIVLEFLKMRRCIFDYNLQSLDRARFIQA